MILSGPAIRGAVERGEIDISPFDPERLNPASYDLELGPMCAFYTAVESDAAGIFGGPSPKWVLDSKEEQNLTTFEMSENGFQVEPGRLYLMHTRERICTRKYIPVLDGKSSIGRLGVLVHVTAGYGDPGFDGQYTLEVTSIAHSVVLYPGMKIAQMRFHAMSHGVLDQPPSYQERGNYVGVNAVGPVRSASWRQFQSKAKADG